MENTNIELKDFEESETILIKEVEIDESQRDESLLERGENLKGEDTDSDRSERGQENRSDKKYQNPLAKFRHAAARVQFMCRVQINLNRYATEAGKGAFAAGITDMVNKLSKGQQVVYVQENETSKETITFNAGDYKTNHEFHWPKTGHVILEKKPEERTQEDIRIMCNLMRGLHSFRKYSKKMQNLIAKVVRYQKYGRRRVVIRKGHPGFSFYFIFSGAVCVTLDEDEESVFTKKEVTVLRKGVCFGEIALLKDVPRMATIMCLEDTELLIVDKDEFFDNGLHFHIQQEFQYRLKFFRDLDIFSTWPNDKLEEISDMGRLEEYHYDSVIVKDSRENEWLLFITKGRCDVLRLVDLAKLHSAQVKEEEEPKRNPVTRVRSRSNLLIGDYPLSLLPEGQQSPYPWLVPATLPERPKTTGQISRRTSKEDMETRTRAENRCKSAGIHREMSIHRQESGDVDENPPELRQQLNDAYSKQKRRGSTGEMELKLPNHMTLGMGTMKGPEVDAGVYIRVDSLGPGQCFGIEGVKGTMPKLSLLSLGCEIVRVSLSKFREYADEQTLEKIHGMTASYPDNQFLWSNFREEFKWSSFKNGIVQDVLENYSQTITTNTFVRDLRSGPGSSLATKSAKAYRRQKSQITAGKSNPTPKIHYAATHFIDNKIPSQNRHTATFTTQPYSNRSTFGDSSRSVSAFSRPKTSTLQTRRISRPPSTLPVIQTSPGQVSSCRPLWSCSISNRPQSVHYGGVSGQYRPTAVRRPATSVKKK
ncbi:cyclic nucleotide-binding domain-containing protein 2-like isoform X3 [Apostichopus japonicus]|uniref:cyclic nucleotide-binding domain-containing protein 2-like isoform X3 n=1 Tax=Stichopus japonicus TaxID=307972 RepID=UPI003AB8A339